MTGFTVARSAIVMPPASRLYVQTGRGAQRKGDKAQDRSAKTNTLMVGRPWRPNDDDIAETNRFAVFGWVVVDSQNGNHAVRRMLNLRKEARPKRPFVCR